jgi:ribosomal protein S21
MRLRDGEPIGQALRRFKKLIERNRDRRKWRKPHDTRNGWPYFVSKADIRRHKQHCKLVKTRAASAAKQTGKS